MPSPTCRTHGCSGIYLARGFCSAHYQRFRLGWTEEEIVAGIRVRLCSSLGQGCREPAWRLGLCATHYALGNTRQGRPCTVAGCQGMIIAKGFCPLHYQRSKRGLSGARLEAPKRQPKRTHTQLIKAAEDAMRAQLAKSVPPIKAAVAKSVPSSEAAEDEADVAAADRATPEETAELEAATAYILAAMAREGK